MDSTPGVALVGATVYAAPACEPIRDAVVLIGGREILGVGTRARVRIPRETKAFDCSGCFITAAFWNSHVHFFERKWAAAAELPAGELAQQLQEFARYGFTSVFDLSSRLENTQHLRTRIDSGEVPGPRIRTTGEGLVPADGAPSDEVCRVLGLMETALPEVRNAAQAGEFTQRLLDNGVDGIKLFASSPSGSLLGDGSMEAAVAVAHAAGRYVFVHPNTADDALVAMRAGADVIAHTTPRSGPWDETLLAEVRARECALVPTLKLWRELFRHDRISVRDRVVQIAVAQLRAWLEAGGSVLFGTDLGAVDGDPTCEYNLMTEAGMTFDGILASLTTAPAARFACAERFGRIAPGLQADLVVLDADPSSRIENLAEVRATLRAGEFVYGSGSLSTFA